MDGLRGGLWYCGSHARLLYRIRRCHSEAVHESCFLVAGACFTRSLPHQRFRLEIVGLLTLEIPPSTNVMQRKTNVLSTVIPSHPRNPEIQYSRLQTKACNILPRLTSHANILVEWNNFKKQFAKYDKYNACASSVATPFRKPTSRKRAYYKPTIRPENVGGMVRWRVRGRKVGDDEGRVLYETLGNSTVFFCFAMVRGWERWFDKEKEGCQMRMP